MNPNSEEYNLINSLCDAQIEQLPVAVSIILTISMIGNNILPNNFVINQEYIQITINSTLKIQDEESFKFTLDLYEEQTFIEPNNTDLLLTKEITAIIAQKKYEQSLEIIDQAIQVEQNNYFAYYTKGFIYRLLKQYDMAIQQYDQTININPNYINAYINKGYAL